MRLIFRCALCMDKVRFVHTALKNLPKYFIMTYWLQYTPINTTLVNTTPRLMRHFLESPIHFCTVYSRRPLYQTQIYRNHPLYRKTSVILNKKVIPKSIRYNGCRLYYNFSPLSTTPTPVTTTLFRLPKTNFSCFFSGVSSLKQFTIKKFLRKQQ